MEVTYFVRNYFFDRQRIQQRVDAGRRRALSKGGAWIRRKARSLLRRRKRISRPGEPPSVHADPGLKTILFFWDPNSKTVVVGPIRFNQVNTSWIDGQRRPVPGVLEFGDVLTIKEWRFAALQEKDSRWDKYTSSRKFSSEWKRQDLRWRDAARKRRGRRLADLKVETRRRRAIVKARPFMGPALRQTLPELPATVRDMMGPRINPAAA